MADGDPVPTLGSFCGGCQNPATRLLFACGASNHSVLSLKAANETARTITTLQLHSIASHQDALVSLSFQKNDLQVQNTKLAGLLMTQATAVTKECCHRMECRFRKNFYVDRHGHERMSKCDEHVCERCETFKEEVYEACIQVELAPGDSAAHLAQAQAYSKTVEKVALDAISVSERLSEQVAFQAEEITRLKDMFALIGETQAVKLGMRCFTPDSLDYAAPSADVQ